MEATFGPAVWDRTAADLVAPRLAVPALLLHDPSDDETPFSETVELAAAWPGARLVPVAGLGHRRLLRHPSTVSATLEFLAEGR
jgi:pimeloyl-ACP methyl ester carboxylesterase